MLVEFFGNGVEPRGENLFTISNRDNYRASIKTGIGLRGHSGIWTVHILATDRGAGDVCTGASQEARKAYNITIEPYNFDAPAIIFPGNSEAIRAE